MHLIDCLFQYLVDMGQLKRAREQIEIFMIASRHLDSKHAGYRALRP